VLKLRAVLSFLAICTLVISSPASAHSSVVQDAAGDIAAGVPAYLDIVKAKVHATGDDQGGHASIVFSMKLAEPIPQLSSVTFLAVNWLLNTDADPELDYNVLVRWCTRTAELTTHPRCQEGPAHWEATVNDFTTRPLRFLSTFNVEGDEVTMWIDPTEIGGASEFTWLAAARNIAAQSGAAVDVAPDIGLEPFRR
jgi:hypothetical protein